MAKKSKKASPETKDLVAVDFAAPFKFSPDGMNVVEYEAGPAEVSSRCAMSAQSAGVLEDLEA